MHLLLIALDRRPTNNYFLHFKHLHGNRHGCNKFDNSVCLLTSLEAVEYAFVKVE